MNKTVKFLGKRYSVGEAQYAGNGLLWLDAPGATFSGEWETGTSGRLCELATQPSAKGNTAQEAVNALEKRLYSDFAELGELLGWEVER